MNLFTPPDPLQHEIPLQYLRMLARDMTTNKLHPSRVLLAQVKPYVTTHYMSRKGLEGWDHTTHHQFHIGYIVLLVKVDDVA